MITLEAFAEIIGQNITLTRYQGQKGRWCCQIDRAEVMLNGGLLGEHGNGTSPDAAMADYARLIAGKRIAINAMTKDRREYNVPAELVGGAK